PEIEQNATFVSVLVLKPSVAQALLGPRCVYTIAAEGLGDKKATNRAVGVFVPNRGQRQISTPRRRPVVGLDVAGDVDLCAARELMRVRLRGATRQRPKHGRDHGGTLGSKAYAFRQLEDRVRTCRQSSTAEVVHRIEADRLARMAVRASININALEERSI